MGQTIGRIQTYQLSASEFSYEWHFCKVNFDLIYHSPPFKSIRKEFSNCYLEMKPHIINRVLTFYLCGCEKSESKITSTAVLSDGHCISVKSSDYDAELDLGPSMKIFEINLSDPILANGFDFIFKVDVKLHCYFAFISSILNESDPLQNIQLSRESSFASSTSNRVFSSTLNEKPKSFIDCNREFFTTFDDEPAKNYIGHNNETFHDRVITRRHTFFDEPAHTNFDEESIKAKGIKASSNVHSVGLDKKPKSAPTLEYTKELIQDLKCLFSSGSMHDLEIRIDENIIHAHKLILCARSTVFKKMMEHDFIESSSNCITITDCSASSFKAFLRYIYTGEIDDSTTEIVMSLYSLGDKYGVSVLPEACSNILQNKLSSETVDDVANIICDVLQLAECQNDSKLKVLAESFIVRHFPVVSNKQSWKDLMKSNLKLASEILSLVAIGLQKAQT